MDAYKLDHGERHSHKSLKTEARADKNLPAAHRRGRDPAGIPRIPPGSGGSTGLRGDTFVFSTAIARSRDGRSGGAILASISHLTKHISPTSPKSYSERKDP